MRRLLVSTSHEPIYRGIAMRLRGAVAEWDGARAAAEPFAEGCDAVAFPFPYSGAAAGLALGVRAGKHLLLVDPWRVKAEAVTWTFAMARAAGLRFVVANHERYRPSLRLIHQELTAGKLGKPGLVRIHHWRQLAIEDSKLGDGLPTTLMHELDVAIWLAGARPNLVYAGGDVAEVGAYLQVHLGFDGGAMALIDYCSRLPKESDGCQSISVIGSSGAAYADDQRQMQLAFGGGVPRAHVAHGDHAEYSAIVQDFVDGAPAEEGLAMSHTQWQWVRAAADAVRQSLSMRQAVRVEAV